MVKTLPAEAGNMGSTPGLGSFIKEFPCQCRRHRLDPWSGKVPHATEPLMLCATTAETVLEPMCSKTSHSNEKHPCTTAAEKPPLSATQRPSQK